MVLGYFLWRKQRTRILLIFKRGFYPIISVALGTFLWRTFVEG